MKRIIRKKSKEKENIHLQKENEYFLVKIIYSPTSSDFLYSIIIKNKLTNVETKQDIGIFNITKASFSLGEIVIENNLVKVIPKKRNTAVYNLHEKDIKTYIFNLK